MKSSKRYPRRLAQDERALFDRQWLHNYAPLGVPTEVRSPAHAANQLEMQGVLFRFIRDALGRCDPNDQGLLMTYGDGFYGLYAATKSRGPMSLFLMKHESFEVPDVAEQTKLMAKLLGLDKRTLVREGPPPSYADACGFGICVGVLPNLKDPRPTLDLLRQIISGPLVLQTSVSPTRLERDYFFDELVWRSWGCRFSHEWLINAVVEAGWTVINEAVGELPGSEPIDGASSYLLCV